jgi:hypothetical protein
VKKSFQIAISMALAGADQAIDHAMINLLQALGGGRWNRANLTQK